MEGTSFVVNAADCQNLEEVSAQILELGDDGFDNLVNLESVNFLATDANILDPFVFSFFCILFRSLVLVSWCINSEIDMQKTKYM